MQTIEATVTAELSRRIVDLGGVEPRAVLRCERVAFWSRRREVADLAPGDHLDVRLTRPVIREHLRELRLDPRVRLHRGSSDWVTLSVRSLGDVDWAVGWVAKALAAGEAAPRRRFL